MFCQLEQINELRLLILKQQQQMQDLEIEVNNLRCYIDNAWESNDEDNSECFIPVQRASIMLTVR